MILFSVPCQTCMFVVIVKVLVLSSFDQRMSFVKYLLQEEKKQNR